MVKGAVWLWFCNSQICGNSRFLLREHSFLAKLPLCKCAPWCTTSYRVLAKALITFVSQPLSEDWLLPRVVTGCSVATVFSVHLQLPTSSLAVFCASDEVVAATILMYFWCFIGDHRYRLTCCVEKVNKRLASQHKNVFLFHVSSFTIFYTVVPT